MKARRTTSDDRGVSLVEMCATLAVIGVISALATPVLSSTLGSGSRLESQSRSLDELRLAMTEVGRQARSAECVYAPTLAVPDGNTLSMRTDANNQLHTVVYTLTGGQLTKQVDGGASRVVAGNLTGSQAAFHYSSTPRTSLVLTFATRIDPRQSPRLLTTTIAGRNAWHTPPAC